MSKQLQRILNEYTSWEDALGENIWIILGDNGQSWFIEGNREILDIKVKNKQISYETYPDTLARLHAVFHSHDGNYVVVSAKPGYEFKGESSPTHVGGASHGGLHHQDSCVSPLSVERILPLNIYGP